MLILQLFDVNFFITYSLCFLIHISIDIFLNTAVSFCAHVCGFRASY